MNMFEVIQAFAFRAATIALNEPRTVVLTKNDGSPVSQAELIITEEAQRFFSQATPEALLLCEEQPASAVAECRQPLIIIDNIDGTHRYIAGLPDWTISIGVTLRGLPLMGVVYDPVRQEMISCNGGQVFHHLEGQLSTGCKITRPADILTIPDATEANLFRWNSKLSRCPMARATGRALMNVVLGHADVLALQNHIWDIAGIWPALLLGKVRLYSRTTEVSSFSLEHFDVLHQMRDLFFFSHEDVHHRVREKLWQQALTVT